MKIYVKIMKFPADFSTVELLSGILKNTAFRKLQLFPSADEMLEDI
jgi:hypothetical protein